VAHLLQLFALVVAVLGPELVDGPAVARQIAAEYAAQARGISTLRVTTQLDARGGPVHVTEQSETLYAEENGVAIRKRVLKEIRNGKAAGSDDLAKLSRQEEGPISRFGLKAPYWPANLAEYTFGTPHEAADVVSLDFTSNVKDTFHGNGTIFYGRSIGRIEKVIYKPVVFPKQPNGVVLTSMNMEITFGHVTAERWDVVKIVRTFTAREGLFGGRGTATTVYEQYRFHPTEAAALAVVDEP
jgi:hypothetical protein